MSLIRATLFVGIFTGLTAGASLADAPAPTLLSPVFQDHAVIQRDKPITVWGDAAPGAKIAVSLAGNSAKAVADNSGRWQAVLPALPAGGPHTLTATAGGHSQSASDILIGDVYLCSGQSNMEMPVHTVSNYDADLNGASNPNIRLMHVERFSSPTPRGSFGNTVSWAVTSPKAVYDYSATCYYFGRELQPDIKVPLGLIESAWGGTAIQSWIPTATLRKHGYGPDLDMLDAYRRDPAAAEEQWRRKIAAWWTEHDPASAAATPWSDPKFDDGDWDRFIPGGAWEGWGIDDLRNFDGVIWLRKHLTLTAAQAAGAAKIDLGPVDDFDTTYVNGVHVGGGSGWDTPRSYAIPAGTLHAGDNVIAVGVLDTGGGGGMWGPAADKVLTLADGSKLALDTPWRYRISAGVNQTGGLPLAPWNGASGLAMLYNGMIEPLGPIKLKGMIWYQGESNSWEAAKYGTLLTALIEGWRARFGEDLPFVTVQLPGYGAASVKPIDSSWAVLREQQRLASNALSNAHLAVTIDLGMRDNIHPADKQNVGRRLALIAKKHIYGMDVVADGPRPLGIVRNGRWVAVKFDQRLSIHESNRPISFQLCDGDRGCVFADAAAQNDIVQIDAQAMPDAKEIRFCWSDSPICNVYNAAGLPAVPFKLPITVK